MKSTVQFLVAALALSWLGAACAGSFTLQVSTFSDGASLPQQQVYSGCNGANVSPALHWSGAPSATRSFAVTVFDPDAGNGRGWWHWLAYDIAPHRAGLAAAAGVRDAAGMKQGRNDFGHARYDGPCPPPSPAHHYRFTVYALDVPTLKPDAPTPAAVDQAIRRHALARAQQTLLYRRYP